jgi:hypothetical protein
MSISKFIGVDVHKESNSVAVADSKGGEAGFSAPLVPTIIQSAC